MSIRQKQEPKANLASALETLNTGDAALAEGNSYTVSDADTPLRRNVVVSIRASLNDLCLSKAKASWQPTSEALRAIFQQKKFTALDGSAEPTGDLRSVVLHKMDLKHVKSSFPLALGARISGVDDITYSSTGESFSTIVLPSAESTAEKCLQSDDVSLGALPCVPDTEPGGAPCQQTSS
jgi:hypothetical protein